MSYRLKALQVSVAVHLLVVVALIGIGGFLEPAKKRIVIDFSIENRALTPDNPAPNLQPGPVKEVRQVANTRQVERAPVPPSPEQPKAEQRPQEVPVVAPALSETQAPVAASPVPQRQAVKTDAVARVHQGSVEARPVSHAPEGKGASSGADAAKNRYLKENFSYINTMVQKKAVYPMMARRMGWEGKVLVSFIISQGGQVSDIKITRSSGKEILDKSALEAVKNASPFPRPPAETEAELTIPIAFRLN